MKFILILFAISILIFPINSVSKSKTTKKLESKHKTANIIPNYDQFDAIKKANMPKLTEK